MTTKTPARPASAGTDSKRGRLGGAVRYGLVLALIVLVLLEVALRLVAGRAANGMPAIGRFALLPYRPPAPVVREHLEGEARGKYLVPDAELGWTIEPSREAGPYASNADRVRCAVDRQFAPEPPAGVTRLLTFGDSFTHGDEVTNPNTWQHQLEELLEDTEVLNLGVPGYGTDQAFLRYRRFREKFGAQHVVLGIWPENICRNLNVVRYYLVPTGNFATKPRFVEKSQALELVNSPVITGDALVELLSDPHADGVLAHDYWFRPGETTPDARHALMTVRAAESVYTLFSRRHEREALYDGSVASGIDITVAIARTFAQEVRDSGSQPHILILPMRSLLHLQTEEPPFPLVGKLREAGLHVIDLGPQFLRRTNEHGAEKYFLPSGHLNPEGNGLVARLLADVFDPPLTAGNSDGSGSG